MMTRREALTLMGAGLGAMLLPLWPAFAQSASVQDLATPGPLGDVTLGSPDAKIAIVEYASLTCSHCATFHKETFPELKKRYIDTGKVRFTLREFPLDPLATAGFMLARCDGNDKYYAVADLLFEQQRNWAFVDKPLDALQRLMRQAGFSQQKFESCLKDQKLLDAVSAVRKRGEEAFKINSTPTFFINGQRQVGALSIDDIEKIIKPMLGA